VEQQGKATVSRCDSSLVPNDGEIMKIALAQIDTTVGDFDGNAQKILDGVRWAESEGVDLIVFPEMCVCGYPPRDLLEKPSFLQKSLDTVRRIAAGTKGTAAVIGYITPNEASDGHALFNTAGILSDGEVKFEQHKTLLPEYDVFDEARHFEPACDHRVYEIDGVRIGLSLCEDMWSKVEFRGRRLYQTDPIEKLVSAGAEMIINISASPFTLGKREIRRELARGMAKRFGTPVIYCNAVGGNDDLVFDGRSVVVNGGGEVIRKGLAFAEDTIIIDTDEMQPITKIPTCTEEEEIHGALVLGLSDYMRKCGFKRAVLGLSGGIDSAVVAAIAAEAIGPENVTGILMPSPYSSQSSIDDALELAKNLGIKTSTIPIGDIYEGYREMLGFDSAGDVSLAEENIQARIRGNILMAKSNSEGAIVLATGNKSELSVGYCTLYGDMAGGFALISDVLKTQVFALAGYMNRNSVMIPESIINKAPSAELKPDQTDQDALPAYEILDPIVKAYVEEKASVEEIAAQGIDIDIVRQITGMIDHNEYKRRQAPPGIKITQKAFGSGRRFPIACKF
jgi:NAD+ synthase (glutamine-hydrolysing)